MKRLKKTVLTATLLSATALQAHPAFHFAKQYTKLTCGVGFYTSAWAYALQPKDVAYHINKNFAEPNIINDIQSTLLRAPLRCALLPALTGKHIADYVFLTTAERVEFSQQKQPKGYPQFKKKQPTPEIKPEYSSDIYAALL